MNDTYEPGSTYKILTLAMALEEGVVTKNSTFNCTGSVRVGVETIHCSKRAGHGLQDLTTATANSCNPSFINMGLRIGSDTYYDYMDAFGLFEPTGVDLQGEGENSVTDRKTFTSSDIYVACYSFGQTFTVTPLQLIAAQAACINGGYLYTPYVVEQVRDSAGNVISQHDATPGAAGHQRGNLRHSPGNSGVRGVQRHRQERPGGRLPHRRQDRHGG